MITSSGFQTVDVRDLAALHTALIERIPPRGGRYIATGRFLPWEEYAELLDRAAGIRLPRAKIPGHAVRFFGRVGDRLRPPLRRGPRPLARGHAARDPVDRVRRQPSGVRTRRDVQGSDRNADGHRPLDGGGGSYRRGPRAPFHASRSGATIGCATGALKAASRIGDSRRAPSARRLRSTRARPAKGDRVPDRWGIRV